MTSEKTYFILDQFSKKVEHVIVFDNETDTYSLRYSKESFWSDHVQGTEILNVVNTGNGYVISWTRNVKKGHMEYDEADYLRIMLCFINQLDNVKKGPFNTKPEVWIDYHKGFRRLK